MPTTSTRIVALALFAATLMTNHPAAPAVPRDESPAARDKAPGDARPVILAQNSCSSRGCP
jgi:hypothetical protein